MQMIAQQRVMADDLVGHRIIYMIVFDITRLIDAADGLADKRPMVTGFLPNLYQRDRQPLPHGQRRFWSASTSE